MDINGEYQDGVIARYIVSKGLPDSIQITTKRLAQFCAKHLSKEVIERFTSQEQKELNMSGYNLRLRLRARGDLRNAYRAGKVKVEKDIYIVKRVEDWPEYHIALEREGSANNGTH